MKKTAFLVILQVLIFRYNCAQSFQWARQENYSDQQISESVGTDSSGNVYISGMYLNSYHSAGPVGCFISKYNSTGNLLWTDTISGVLFIKSVVDSSGNIFATGYFGDSTKFDCSVLTGPYYSGFVARYNSAGNCVFANKTTLSGTAIALAGTNAFITSGNEGFLTKYDYYGNVSWTQNVIKSGYCAGNSICTDLHDTIFIAGQYTDSVLFGSGMNATQIKYTGYFNNNFIAKFDPNGNFIWVKTPQVMYGIDKFNLCTDTAGNCYFTGWFTYSLLFDSLNFYQGDGNERIITGKYNPGGVLEWSQVTGDSSSSNEAWDIKADDSGNYYITGQFYGTTDFGGQILQGTDDLFIAKYDAGRNLQWVQKSNGISGNYSPSAHGYALALDEKRNAVYISGKASDQISFGNCIINAADYGSVLVLKLSNDTLFTAASTNLNSITAASLKIFPNPSSGIFTISANDLHDAKICVRDIFGNCMLTKNISDQNNSIDLGEPPKGIYFIQISNHENVFTKKIIVE